MGTPIHKRDTHQNKAAKLLARTPTLTNSELVEMLKFSDPTAFTRARKTLGIEAPQGQPGFVKVVHATYYAACRGLRVQPLRIPESGVFSRHRAVGTVVEEPDGSGSTTPRLVMRHLSLEDVLPFMAKNPGAPNKAIQQHFRTNTVGSFIAGIRTRLGYRYSTQPLGYRVERQKYLATCKDYGVEPVEMPEQEFVFFPMTKSSAARTVSAVTTVPTVEVPPAVLAETPRELRPETPEEVEAKGLNAKEGDDQYAQLRGIVAMLRTEMAKRGIETVRIEPGGVVIRRTVVVEEPFV